VGPIPFWRRCSTISASPKASAKPSDEMHSPVLQTDFALTDGVGSFLPGVPLGRSLHAASQCRARRPFLKPEAPLLGRGSRKVGTPRDEAFDVEKRYVRKDGNPGQYRANAQVRSRHVAAAGTVKVQSV
jgi:hypothetical protein